MSSINPVTPQPAVQPATATPNVAPAGTATTAQPGTMPPTPSAAGQTTVAKPVVFNGLQGLGMGASGTTSRFSRDASFDTYTAPGAGPVGRGFLRCDAAAIPGGCRLHVQTFHSNPNDKITLYLLAEVLDTKTNQLRTINLSVLANAENLNGATYRGERYFDISYADLDKYLQTRNPALKVTPGSTNLGVAGLWPTGHQAGGFGRGGVFRLPPSQQTQNVVAVRAAARGGAAQADLPLDMQVAYPAALVQQVPQLKADGNILTRLESEFKGSTGKEEMTAAVREMYRLAEAAIKGKSKDVEAVLGKDWTVETVNRYWLKDDGSPNLAGSPGKGFFKGFRVDADGLPIQDPMRDNYMDDANLGMTRHEGAIRLRTNKQATVINVKPGGGRLDPKTGVVQRVEVGVELRPECGVQEAASALQLLGSGQWSGTVFNHAQNQVRQLDPNLALQNCLRSWLDVVQNRHKFTVKNVKTGVEIELSLDKVECKTTRPEHANPDGSPRTAEFYVLEAELDHLQLVSQNKSSFVAANTTNTSFFANDQQQDQWLQATSPQVTMDIDPRLHELKDLDNESFRSTSSYTAFKDVIATMLPTLFPKGMGPGRQKAAHAAELVDLVFFSDAEMLKGVSEIVEKGGYRWSPALEAAFDAAIKNPQLKLTLEQSLVNGTQRAIPTLMARFAPSVPLEYDLPKMKAVLRGRLAGLGFEFSPEVEAMFDKLTPQLLPPANFEALLLQIAGYQDAQILSQFAAKLGVTPAPVPKADVAHLLSDPLWQSTLATQLAAAYLDPGQTAEIKSFLSAAAAQGATMFEIRQLIAALGSSSQVRLDQMAQQRNLVGKAPKLRASVDRLVAEAAPQLRRFFLAVDDEMRKLLQAVAAGCTPPEALQWVRGLANGAEAQIELQAKRLGVPVPPLAYDFAAIDATLQPVCANVRVLYDATLKQFVRDAVTAGVPVVQLQTALGRLANQPSLSAALKSINVYIVGLKIPTTQFDVPGIEVAVRQLLPSYAQVLAGGTALAQFIEALLGRGLTPAQAQTYAQYVVSYGPAQSAQYAGLSGMTGLPPLPVDVGALCKTIQQRYGTQWTPVLEQYLQSALPLAEKDPRYILAQAFSLAKPQLVSYLQQLSGLAPPAGI